MTDTDQENFISHINRLDKPSPPSKLVSSTPVPRQVVQNSGRTGRSTTTAKPEPSEVTDPYGQHETSFYETTTATELATTFEILSASPEYSEIPRSSFSQLDKIDEEVRIPTFLIFYLISNFNDRGYQQPQLILSQIILNILMTSSAVTPSLI